MIVELENPEKAAALFAGWEETIIWSCLQGVMGTVYADSQDNPDSAAATLGDFAFLAGEPREELVFYTGGIQDFIIMVPQSDGWAGLIEKCYGEKAKKVTRYALKKEPYVFDREKLNRAASMLPPEYSMKMMDKELFDRCKTDWCRDWVAQYADYEAYQKYGLGVVILKDGISVSGASAYSGYRGGIEIEIDTREEYRRKGLAYICGAQLILECLDRKLYPSWDAQNPESVKLAEKLGYHFAHAYAAYEVTDQIGLAGSRR